MQWLILLAILFSGVFLYRRLFMPLYIFLAVMATNGTLVLFMLKVKQLVDARINISELSEPEFYLRKHFSVDISLNMLGLLLFCAVLHDIVYFYAIHLKLVESRPVLVPGFRVYDATMPNHYSTIHSTRMAPNKNASCETVDIV